MCHVGCGATSGLGGTCLILHFKICFFETRPKPGGDLGDLGVYPVLDKPKWWYGKLYMQLHYIYIITVCIYIYIPWFTFPILHRVIHHSQKISHQPIPWASRVIIWCKVPASTNLRNPPIHVMAMGNTWRCFHTERLEMLMDKNMDFPWDFPRF